MHQRKKKLIRKCVTFLKSFNVHCNKLRIVKSKELNSSPHVWKANIEKVKKMTEINPRTSFTFFKCKLSLRCCVVVSDS